MLLLLSRFSRIRLCATPQMAAHQAPLSLGFSRQEHWSGLPFPSPMMKGKNESEVAQSCPTLSDPMDCSLPGSSVHGIFQARVLEWGAIAFSSIYVYLWLIHGEVGQKTAKFCKAIILQLKKYIHIYIKNKQTNKNYQYTIKDKFSTNLLWTLLPYVSQAGTKTAQWNMGPHLNDIDHSA